LRELLSFRVNEPVLIDSMQAYRATDLTRTSRVLDLQMTGGAGRAAERGNCEAVTCRCPSGRHHERSEGSRRLLARKGKQLPQRDRTDRTNRTDLFLAARLECATRSSEKKRGTSWLADA
jgi:hypothetical protein